MILNFDPGDFGTVTRTNRPLTDLAGGLEPRSRYTIRQPAAPTAGPLQLSPAGYDLASSQWVLLRYDTTVTGQNEDYGTRVAIDVGLCYGPVEAGSYR
jgi:hypothetical protein